MHIRPDGNRAERTARLLLFLALMLGVAWAMADRGEAAPAAALVPVR